MLYGEFGGRAPVRAPVGLYRVPPLFRLELNASRGGIGGGAGIGGSVGVAGMGVAEGLAVARAVTCAGDGAAPHAVARTATNPMGASHLTEVERGPGRIAPMLDAGSISITGRSHIVTNA
jgi:hypothetical protein